MSASLHVAYYKQNKVNVPANGAWEHAVTVKSPAAPRVGDYVTMYETEYTTDNVPVQVSNHYKVAIVKWLVRDQKFDGGYSRHCEGCNVYMERVRKDPV